MDIIISVLSLSLVFLSLAIFTNKIRSRQTLPFELEPNCLLTRWPLLFITGPRSIFYFSSYWNIYTSFLAEHGYEVFTLNLPWNNTELRHKRFQFFLDQQEKNKRHFHLVLDRPTFEELKDILQERRYCVVSVTELVDGDFAESLSKSSSHPLEIGTLNFKSSKHPSIFMPFCYQLHRHLTKNKDIPSLDTLGANPETAISNSLKLLERAKILAEMDLTSCHLV